ncbi:hypothetical protein F383_21096 [Gossypium arboreum]|uniref:Uncharacterized protein n=1 Tax=Gossypium arboreum TaxID=29729 RepID=A0A0B0MGQ7_GOSAR|nr:hypothetical protein F383_21096 [Gossypium arboreum]
MPVYSAIGRTYETNTRIT